MRLTPLRNAIVYLSLLALLLWPVAAQADGARLVVTPANGMVGINQTAAVAVRILDVTDLYGLDVHLGYDPAVLEVMDADPTLDGIQVQPGNLLNYDFAIRNFADNTVGEIWFAVAQLNPSEPKSGSGDVFTVVFRGKQEGGNSTLDLTSVKLSTRTGAVIAATAEGGQLTVVAPTLAPPTPTNAPPPPTPQVILPTSTPDPAQPTPTPRTLTRTPAPTLIPTSAPIGLASPTPGPTNAALPTNTLQAIAAAPLNVTQPAPTTTAPALPSPFHSPAPTATIARLAAALAPPTSPPPTIATAGSGIFRGEGTLLPGLEAVLGIVIVAAILLLVRWLKRRRTQ